MEDSFAQESTGVKSNQNPITYEEALLTEKMKDLADKAYKLSLKYDLSDEAKLI